MGRLKVKPLYVSLKPFIDHRVLPIPVQWLSVFGNDNPLEVEIGIGNGEYLARLAQENPHVNYVGFEEYGERVSRSLRKLSRGSSDHVKVLRLDVRPAFHYYFNQRSIDFIHCLYPPPWPKKSDIKHRLLNTTFLRLCNSRLKDEKVMRIVTDFKPYARWITEQAQDCGFDITENAIGATFGTEFERKWQDEGKKEFHEILLKKDKHWDISVKGAADVRHYVFSDFNPDVFSMPDYTDGQCAVILKGFLYDPKRLMAQAHVLVHDEQLLQHTRVTIVKTDKGWHVGLAQGSMQMPTPGVAKAIECVYQAALKSGK